MKENTKKVGEPKRMRIFSLLIYVPIFLLMLQFGQYQLNDWDWYLWIGLYWGLAGLIVFRFLTRRGWPTVERSILFGLFLWALYLFIFTPSDLLWKDSEESRELGGLAVGALVILLLRYWPPKLLRW